METSTILIDLGTGVLKQLAASLSNSKVPGEIIDAITGVVDALEKHKDDVITKANLDAQRG